MVVPLSSSPLRSVPISRSCQSTLRAQWAHGNCRRTRQYLLTFLILSHHTWQKRILILYILFAMCELLLLLYTQPPTPINIPSLNSSASAIYTEWFPSNPRLINTEAVLQAFRNARTRLLCFDNEGTLANDKRCGWGWSWARAGQMMLFKRKNMYNVSIA